MSGQSKEPSSRLAATGKTRPVNPWRRMIGHARSCVSRKPSSKVRKASGRGGAVAIAQPLEVVQAAGE